MNKELETLRAKESQLKAILNLDIEKMDSRTSFSWKGKINEAKEELPLVQARILNLVLLNSTVVQLTKDLKNVNDFKDIVSTQDDNSIIVDYYTIENLIFNKIYGDKSGPYMLNSETRYLINEITSEWGHEMDALQMPQVNISGNLMGLSSTKENFISRLTVALDQTFGNEMRNLYTNFLIRKEVMKKMASTDKVFVFITNTPIDGLSDIVLPSKRIVTVTGNEKIGFYTDPNSSGEELVQAVQNALKNKKQGESNE